MNLLGDLSDVFSAVNKPISSNNVNLFDLNTPNTTTDTTNNNIGNLKSIFK